MKIAGLLLLVLAGGGIGWLRAASLRRRAASLEAARRLVLWLTARLRYTAEPVGTLLRQAAACEEFRSLPWLDAVSELRDGAPFAATWAREVDKSAKLCGFTSSDIVLLHEFGEGLGKTDLTGQQAHGELYAALLEERRQQAENAVRDRGRMECVLWTSGALLTALLLL